MNGACPEPYWPAHRQVVETMIASGHATRQDVADIIEYRSGARPTDEAVARRLRRWGLRGVPRHSKHPNSNQIRVLQIANGSIRQDPTPEDTRASPSVGNENAATAQSHPAGNAAVCTGGVGKVDKLPRDLQPVEPAPEHNVILDDLPRKALLIFDPHIPVHDPYAVAAVQAYARDERPDLIVFGGDTWDNWMQSGFDKEADRLFDPGARLQEEFDEARPILTAFRETTRRMELLEGNHEHRLERLVNAHPGLFGLRALEWATLAGLPPGCTVHRYGAQLRIGAMTIVHGDRMGSKWGVLHACAWALNRHGGRNIAFGHTHRLESRCRTVWDEHGQPHQYIAINGGHLSDVSKQTYAAEPDWSTGFVMLECWRDGDKPRFTPHLIPIVTGRFSWAGRVYDGHRCQ